MYDSVYQRGYFKQIEQDKKTNSSHPNRRISWCVGARLLSLLTSHHWALCPPFFMTSIPYGSLTFAHDQNTEAMTFSSDVVSTAFKVQPSSTFGIFGANFLGRKGLASYQRDVWILCNQSISKRLGSFGANISESKGLQSL